MQPEQQQQQQQQQRHNHEGNCWDDAFECGECGGHLCDVCHEHDEPRGACETCPPCPPCAAQAAERRMAEESPPLTDPDETAPGLDPKSLAAVLRDDEER